MRTVKITSKIIISTLVVQSMTAAGSLRRSPLIMNLRSNLRSLRSSPSYSFRNSLSLNRLPTVNTATKSKTKIKF
jgi:hypothetical protein